jgi:hypothetical protein
MLRRVCYFWCYNVCLEESLHMHAVLATLSMHT